MRVTNWMDGAKWGARYLGALLAFAALSDRASGTHISGGEIYWNCLGGDQYEITLIVYRDCAGINLDPNYTLPITSPCGSTSVFVTTPGGIEISQLCNLQLPNSTCNGGTLPGTEQYVYTGIATLPPCNSWTISWTENWRNNAISNLQAPGTQLMYIEATMNNVVAPCEDSPQFTNIAIPYVCMGYPNTYSYGAYDAEGDSMTYTLIGARTTNGNPIPYVAPHTPTQPIPGITLDPQTGLLSFTLSVAGRWVVVVRVNIYDASGNLIGTIMRDMQFVAYPCTNQPPDPTTGTIANPTGGVQTAPYALEVCESGSFCFDMVISDPDAANVLDATSNITSNLPGATFSFTSTNPITCHVCWSASAGTAGFYPFIVTVDDGACPIPAFQTYVYGITVIDGLFATVQTVDETCTGAGNGSASVSVTTGNAPFTYAWSNGATTPSINAGAGSYNVVVSDANGCVSAPMPAVINASALNPTASAGPDQVVCFGNWPVLLGGSTTNATTSTWSNGSGAFSGTFPNVQYTPSAMEVSNGGATLILTAANAGCPPDADTVQISLGAGFAGTTIAGIDASCNGVADGSATVLPFNPAFTYLWNATGGSGNTATGLAAGNYSILITDALGCDTTLTVTIGAPAAIAITSVNVTDETCAGNGDGTASLTVTGGTPPYQYSWSNGATTASITAGAGAYTVSVTDASGCAPATATAGINAAAVPPTADAGPDQMACLGAYPIALQGSTINASGSIWSNGAGQYSGTFPNVLYTPSAGEIASGGVNLVLTASSINCPSDQDTMFIALSDGFAGTTITGTDASCNGGSDGSAIVTPFDPSMTYQWSVTGQVGNQATNLPAGSYSVVLTDALGCDTTLAVTLGAPAAIAITSVNVTDETCAGNGDGTADVNVTGGTAPYQYTWSNGATTASITAGTGTYTVSVTDASGCAPATATATINALAQPGVANAGPDAIACLSNLPIALNGSGTYAMSGAWSGGSGVFTGTGWNVTYLPTAAEIAAGAVDLILTVTGAPACPNDADTIQIIIDNSFIGATITSTGPPCAGGTTGTASFTPNDPGFTYAWNDPAAQTTATATGLDAGTYTVTVTNTLGCDTTMSVSVTEPPPLAITNIASADPACSGGLNGFASVTVAGGTPGYTYAWSANAGGQTTAAITNIGAGLYAVVVSDANGCSVNANIIINPSQPVVFIAQVPDTVCANAPVQLTAQASGGTAPYTFGWSGIGTGDTINWIFTSSLTLSVSVVDAAGCTAPAQTFNIVVQNLNTASFTAFGDTTVCPGGSAVIGAVLSGYGGMAQIAWPALGLNGPGPFTVPVDSTQVIQAVASDACGGSLIDQVLLAVDSPPVPVLPAVIAQGCEPLEVNMPALGLGSSFTYFWDLGDGTTSAAAMPSNTYAAGSYAVQVTITSAFGCTSTSNAGVVTAFPNPTAAFNADPWITDMNAPEIDFSDLSSGSINVFDWAFGDGASSTDQNPDHTYAAPGTYYVTLSVTDINGCSDQVTDPVTINPLYDVVIPNAFTPDPNGGNGGSYDIGDLSNNVFYPFIEFVKDFRMRIYDRWGELVFESTDLKIGWDGYYRGQLSQQDVYAVQVWVRFVDDQEAEFLSDLTLIR